MSMLEVRGARMYYESRGTGHPLVMIPGAAGAVEPYRLAASHLAESFTVVLYDRRGFSRSELVGPQDDHARLRTDAEDVRDLIEHLGLGPAIVFGGSSGAIVALEVLTRHPEVVRTLVPHEPPAMLLLPGGQRWVDLFEGIYTLYRQAGAEAAVEAFRARTFGEADRQAMAHVPVNAFSAANQEYWFEHELRQYPAVHLDVPVLETRAGKIIVACGRESRGDPCHEVSAVLAARLGRDLVELPGGHLGYVARAVEWVNAIRPHLVASLAGEAAAESR